MTVSALQQKNIDTVRTALDNARANKLEAAKPFFADDFILYEADGLPFGGEYRGWDGYVDILMRLRAFFKAGERRQDDRSFIPYGDDKVIIHFTVDGYVAKNERHVRMPVLALWELKDGKIARIRPFFFDTKKIADLAAMR
jgi:ketosteroid isomerase-like protein